MDRTWDLPSPGPYHYKSWSTNRDQHRDTSQALREQWEPDLIR